jgi:heat shock protein beta
MLSNDPRYEAVGSSSLREELFTTFLKAQQPNSMIAEGAAGQSLESPQKEEPFDWATQDRKRQDRKERAVKEREEKIKAVRGQVEADIDRSRHEIDIEEGEREFRCAFAMPFFMQSSVALIVCLFILGLC